MDELFVLTLTLVWELQNVFSNIFRYKCRGSQIFQKCLLCEGIAWTMFFNRVTELQSILHCLHTNISIELIVFFSYRRVREFGKLFRYCFTIWGAEVTIRSRLESSSQSPTIPPWDFLLQGLVSEQRSERKFRFCHHKIPWLQCFPCIGGSSFSRAFIWAKWTGA